MQVELLYGTPGFLYTILEAQDYYDNLEEELFRTNFKIISKPMTIDVINIGIAGYEEMSKKKVDLGKLPEDFRLFYTFHKK